MRDKVHHIQSTDVLLAQYVCSMRILLAEDSYEDVCSSDLLFSRRLNMERGALKNTLKAQGRLSFPFDPHGDQWRGFLDEFLKLPSHGFDVGSAGLKNIDCR